VSHQTPGPCPCRVRTYYQTVEAIEYCDMHQRVSEEWRALTAAAQALKNLMHAQGLERNAHDWFQPETQEAEVALAAVEQARQR
jgi:hypothetical protein